MESSNPNPQNEDITTNIYPSQRSNSYTGEDKDNIQTIDQARSYSLNTGAQNLLQLAFFEKENLYPELKSIEIDEELTEFYNIRKHYFIFTEAGKPVYTRYGDEQTMAPFFATMSAIIPKIQGYFWNNQINAREQTNKLKWIESPNFQCCILKKGNFYYVCLSNSREGTTFLDDNLQKKQKKGSKKRRIKESSSFIRKQLEYLHLQFVSLMTSSVNAQLTKRPNLDIKTTIAGLERTLDMMCELSVKSPTVFLEAFQPLRMPENARKAIEKCIQVNKPQSFACGLLVSALNVISVFTDPNQVSDIKSHDITVLLNYIYANPSLKNGETWTPICVPGVSEEYILYVYIHYYTPNVGIIMVCTDHTSDIFFECQKYGSNIYKDIAERGLVDIIDKCTMQMYEQFDMKEIQLVIIRNNTYCQFTTYNFPLLTKVNEFHLECIRIFEKFNNDFEAAQLTQTKKGDFQIIEVRHDYTYSLINFVSNNKDYCIFICFDHRKNNDLVKISKYLMDDIKQEEKNCFITKVI